MRVVPRGLVDMEKFDPFTLYVSSSSSPASRAMIKPTVPPYSRSIRDSSSAIRRRPLLNSSRRGVPRKYSRKLSRAGAMSPRQIFDNRGEVAGLSVARATVIHCKPPRSHKMLTNDTSRRFENLEKLKVCSKTPRSSTWKCQCENHGAGTS